MSDRCDALGGAGQTHAAVAAQRHRVRVQGVHAGQAAGQFDGDQTSLVVGADALVGLDVGRIQHRLLDDKHREI